MKYPANNVENRRKLISREGESIFSNFQFCLGKSFIEHKIIPRFLSKRLPSFLFFFSFYFYSLCCPFYSMHFTVLVITSFFLKFPLTLILLAVR
uniref:Uncharacterized protein n=1 Tax=Octopus bimaculoides TaxID=37653 RepID=A0A0L8G922_OCTBM